MAEPFPALEAHLARSERAFPIRGSEDALQAIAEMTYYTQELYLRLEAAVREARADIAAGNPHPKTIVDRFARLLEK